MAFNFVEGEVLLIDKPEGWTSFDVVNFLRSFLRKIYNLKKLKVGHAGTLDPLATGLLIVCTGKKTKEIEKFQGMPKVYVGTMTIGATTPSYDLETEIDKTYGTEGIDKKLLQNVKNKFTGEIEQLPPAYSAVKIKGERAYQLARKQENPNLKKRKVFIESFELLSFDLPDIDFYVKCSKGTYIRSLVYDFGKALNSGAYLKKLRRTQIGEFNVNSAYTLDEFKAAVLKEKQG
jgi:tRNA pseudouridine55 synthase